MSTGSLTSALQIATSGLRAAQAAWYCANTMEPLIKSHTDCVAGKTRADARRATKVVAAPWSVARGSAQLGAGTRIAGATVKPIEGASSRRSFAHLRRRIPCGVPRSAYDAPRLAGSRSVRDANDRALNVGRPHPAAASHPRDAGPLLRPARSHYEAEEGNAADAAFWRNPHGTGLCATD